MGGGREEWGRGQKGKGGKATFEICGKCRASQIITLSRNFGPANLWARKRRMGEVIEGGDKKERLDEERAWRE